MTTLASNITKYLDGRAAHGEITARTHRLLAARLVSLERACRGPAAALDRTAVLAWAASLTLAPASRRSYVSAVKVFCRWLVAEGVLSVDPSVHLARVREPRRVPRALSQLEVRLLLDAAPDARARATVALMVGCGLRCCEVAALELADWDRGAATVHVVGKAGHERVLPVPAEVAALLGEYMGVRGEVAGALISSQRHRGTAISPAHVSRQVSRWLAAAGVKSVGGDGRSAHALRHTCASDVFESSHDLRVVQEMLGHASVATTSIYLRRADLGRLRRAMAGRDYRAA